MVGARRRRVRSVHGVLIGPSRNTHPSVSVVPVESSYMSGIGIRCSHKRAKRNSGARSKDQGFTHISLPFVPTFEVPFVGGNNHVSGRDLFVVGQLLNVHDKGSERGVSSVQHCATPDCSARGTSCRSARRSALAGRVSIGCLKSALRAPARAQQLSSIGCRRAAGHVVRVQSRYSP